MDQQAQQQSSSADPWSGLVIVLGSIAMVAFMLIHPVVHKHDIAGFVAEAARGSAFNGFVHGTLIGVFLLTFVGFIGFTDSLGRRRPLVRTGLVSYAIGACAHVTAGTINGFIVPALASRYANADTASLEALKPAIVLCSEANGAFARLGVVAMSIGVLLWSVLLVHRPGLTRVIGVLGLLCSALPLIALAAGRLPMNIHGFGAFVLLQSLWNIAVGVQLLRNRL